MYNDTKTRWDRIGDLYLYSVWMRKVAVFTVITGAMFITLTIAITALMDKKIAEVEYSNQLAQLRYENTR